MSGPFGHGRGLDAQGGERPLGLSAPGLFGTGVRLPMLNLK
jgi:hypothetical protein